MRAIFQRYWCQFTYDMSVALSWVRGRRTRIAQSPRYRWWSGFGYAYMMAGFLQSAVFSKAVIGLPLGAFFKFVLIWPLWSFSVATSDVKLGARVLEFTFDIEMGEPSQPAKKQRPAKKMETNHAEV